MFITEESFVNYLNLKSSPHMEYPLVILLLSTASGFWCFIWEVKKEITTVITLYM